MKLKNIFAASLFVCFILGIGGHWNLLRPAQENTKQKELENYLKTARVGPEMVRIGRRTEAYRVSLDDGKIKRGGFLRFTDRTRPDVSIPDSYKYDLAAYELDKLLGFNRVPPAVEREVEGRKCSLQILIEDPLTEKDRRRKGIEPPDYENFKKNLEEIAVFENLTYSPSLCGQGAQEDILIEHIKDWKIWRVDFSEAFAASPELIPGCEITRCSKKLYQNLLKSDDKVIQANLKRYLNSEEISTLLKRKEIIINKIKQLIEEKGEAAVLFS